MRAKFGQPAEWAKFRGPALMLELTALLGTPFPFPFPVVVIGSMIWAVRHTLLTVAQCKETVKRDAYYPLL